MKIQRARLCLDCEELHTEPQCPKCGSNAWCYPFEWIQNAAAAEYGDKSMAGLCA